MARISNIPTITIANAGKVLPSVLIKSAAKCSVRECDETEQNHFVAYVDEGAESFDVSLVFDANGEVSSHACDCKKMKGICKHKVAVLLELANSKSNKAGKITKSGTGKGVKKAAVVSKSQALLDGLNRTELAAWLSSLLQKNKDIELAFLHHFDTQQHLTPEQVKQLTNDAMSSVIKRKTKVDASEVKKIADLWTQIHEPLLLSYKNNPANLDVFDNLHTLIETCLECWARIMTTSNRIDTYIKKALESTVHSIAGLQQTEDWQTALSYYCIRIENKHTYDRTKEYYLEHINSIMSLASSERKTIAVDMLMETYQDLQQKEFDAKGMSRMLFKLVTDAGAQDRYLTLFKPMHWQLEYNVALIKQYMQQGLLKEAEQFCHDQIRANVRQEYNEPYLMILRAIYTAQQDQPKLAKVAEALIPLQWKLDDFTSAATLIKEDKERSAWRTKIFAKARTCSLHGDYAATLFTFALLHEEKNYKKMIDIIDAAATWSLVLEYFDNMYATDPAQLFTKLLNKEEFSSRIQRNNAPDETQALLPLINKLVANYDAELLIIEINGALRYSRSRYPNRFLLRLANALGIQ